MRITSRRKAIITFLILGVSLASIAVAVGFGWTIFNWREGIKVFLGIIFFAAITTGLILNTIFLVREIKRNEQHDSFINAVTHELKSPLASIKLCLDTLVRDQLSNSQREKLRQCRLGAVKRGIETRDLRHAAQRGRHRFYTGEVVGLVQRSERDERLQRLERNGVDTNRLGIARGTMHHAVADGGDAPARFMRVQPVDQEREDGMVLGFLPEWQVDVVEAAAVPVPDFNMWMRANAIDLAGQFRRARDGSLPCEQGELDR